MKHRLIYGKLQNSNTQKDYLWLLLRCLRFENTSIRFQALRMLHIILFTENFIFDFLMVDNNGNNDETANEGDPNKT